MAADSNPCAAALAVGCEEAFLGSHLLGYSRSVTVLDTSGGQLAQLGRRFPEIAFLSHHPASPLPFPANQFDLVWCCEFLDRVFNPATTLREIHRVLGPGGRLFLTVPEAGPVRKVWRALFPWNAPFVSSNPRINQFTHQGLCELAREAGLVEVEFAVRNTGAGRNVFLRASKSPVAPSGEQRSAKKRNPRPGSRGEGLALAARGRAV